jgi:dolichol-phosphate mannosyltransferase
MTQAIPEPPQSEPPRLREISVVVPVRNEADNIEPLVAEICAALEGRWEFEIIYVDDGSDDDTADRLRDAKKRWPRLRNLHHRQSCGQSTAIWTGVRASHASWIVTLDGDGQNDPADIPKLVAVLEDPSLPRRPQMITGIRVRRQDPWMRRVSSRIANSVCGWLLGDYTSDIGCGLKLFQRDSFLSLPYFDHMHRFLPALIRRAGGEVSEVEVHHRPRYHGSSKYGLRDRLWVGIVDCFGVQWLQHRFKSPDVVEDEHAKGTGNTGVDR